MGTGGYKITDPLAVLSIYFENKECAAVLILQSTNGQKALNLEHENCTSIR
jgi:hypothetical protein